MSQSSKSNNTVPLKKEKRSTKKIQISPTDTLEKLILIPTREVVFRTEPIISRETVIRPLSQIEQLTCLESVADTNSKIGKRDQWIKVRDASGQEGYVPAWSVKNPDTLTNEAKRIENMNNNDDSKQSSLLSDAWHQFAVYNQSFRKNSRKAYRLRMVILQVTVLSITLAIIHNSLKPIELNWVMQINTFLKYIVILAPISVSILVSMASSLGANVPQEFLEKNMGSVQNLDTKNSGAQNDYSKIGVAAQLVEREIFLFRTKSGDYIDDPREPILAQRINLIREQLMKTGAIQVGFERYNGPLPPYYNPHWPDSDPGFNDITSDEYIKYRIEDQLRWLEARIPRMEDNRKKLKWMIYIIGGLGTFLAAVGLEIWLAVTGAVVGALTSTLEYQKIDSSIASYNQDATELRQILTWWHSLTDEDKKAQNNFDELVIRTENALIDEAQQRDFFGKKK